MLFRSIVTSAEYIFWPILNQYVGPGFQVSLSLLFLTIIFRMIWDIADSAPKEENGPTFRQWLAGSKLDKYYLMVLWRLLVLE